MASAYDFWGSWKKITPQEKEAISKIEKARKRVIDAVPARDLIAIYIKGSFVRREMREGSDIDMVPIVTKTALEGRVFGVNCDEIYPAMIVPLSLEEFRANNLLTESEHTPDLRAEPDLFLKQISHYGLIYGRPLNPQEFPMRTDQQIVKDEIQKIREGYIPAYAQGKTELPIKELFWLVEFVQLSKGIKVEHSFEGIARSVSDPDHIIHQAYALRKKGERINSQEKDRFIKHLHLYLKQLSKD